MRGISETELRNLIENQIEEPLIGLFGTAKINVLKLNIALDELKK
jgi:K+-transporting ATPase ATPase C chain